MDELPPFPGIRNQGFQFLKDLKANNERDWFKPRKPTFDDELMWPLRCLIADLSKAAPQLGLPLRGDPSKSMFRIYRDTRFSKNKAPYKTHLGAVLSRSGSRKASGGLYIHVEPGNSFAVAGFWQPEKDLLRALRSSIVDQPEDFFGVMDRLDERPLHEFGGKLKRLPRGFESVDDERTGEYIKHKSFVVQHDFTDDELTSPAFTGSVLDAALSMRPLLDWGWHVEDQASAR